MNSKYTIGTLNDGPIPCDLMVIGEAPDDEEIKYGRPFVGKSGKELNRYLWTKCQRMRTSVHVTSLPETQVQLAQDIRRCNPSVICTIGLQSTRALLGEVDMDAVHGIAHQRDGRIILPAISVAAGLHNTEFQAKVAWDFEQLGKVLRGPWKGLMTEVKDAFPDPVYRGLGIGNYNISRPAAVDTEGSVRRPWGLSLCTTPGGAFNLRQGTPHTNISFKDRVIMHSALHDLPVLAAMGIHIGDDQFDDTMIKAYLLCVEPQGLKALCRRHCGMVMQDYQDLTDGASIRHAHAWLDGVIEWLNKQSNSASVVSKAADLRLHSVRPTSRSTSGPGGRKSKKTCPAKRR